MFVTVIGPSIAILCAWNSPRFFTVMIKREKKFEYGMENGMENMPTTMMFQSRNLSRKIRTVNEDVVALGALPESERVPLFNGI